MVKMSHVLEEEDVLNLFVALITVIKSKSNFSIFIVDSRQCFAFRPFHLGFLFLAVIAALYVTMSVGRSVGRSVGLSVSTTFEVM